LSCVLFHGPNARQEALNEAYRAGRLVAPPIGDDGLKIAEVRAAVDLLLSTPVGMDTGVVVIGPMDRTASVKASDGLLKLVEEHPDVVQPILWAFDIGGVSPTIRSRCLDRWCPAVEGMEDEELEGDGRALVRAALEGNLWQIPGLVKAHDKKLGDLLGIAADAILADWTAESMVLWERVRVVAMHRNPTPIEVVSAFLPEQA
tara:strand:+ start:324 stop:932 length:609 start_codon:yes stop_codon:yes gene_type:complete